MNELISGFVGKDCIVYISASSGTSINGVITSLNENWITVKASGIEEVINLDYVIRVKEYPVDKNGKKKRLSFDLGYGLYGLPRLRWLFLSKKGYKLCFS